MALYRETFFYEEGENGWSESIHVNVTDTPTLIALASVYANNRLAATSGQVNLTHIRISDDLVFRDVILDPIALPLPGQFKSISRAEAPWTAIDIRLSANPLVQRSLFFRGMPDGQVNGNQLSFTPAYGAAFNAFVNTIVGGVFSIKNKDRTQLKQPIATISAAGVVNMSAPVAGLGNLDTVQILGIPRSRVPKRTYLVTNLVDQSNFTLRGWNSGVVTATGYLRRIVYNLLPISIAAADFATERRVGRPFGVLRGRRAVVR